MIARGYFKSVGEILLGEMVIDREMVDETGPDASNTEVGNCLDVVRRGRDRESGGEIGGLSASKCIQRSTIDRIAAGISEA